MKIKCFFNFSLFLLATIAVNARVKSVKIVNVTDSIITVGLYVSSSTNELGIGVSEAQKLNAGKSIEIKHKFEDYQFINAVLIRPDGSKIITTSHLNKSESPKDIVLNVTEIKEENIDQAEVQKMNKFIENQIKEFSQLNSVVLRKDNDASAAISEYLGAIMIIDLDSALNDNDKIIKTITARQLGINKTYNFKGKNINKKYRISKDFGTSLDAKFPASFETDLDYSNSDLLEINYSIINLGSILYSTDAEISVIDRLNKYEKSTTEPVFQTIYNIMNECKTCKILRVTEALTFQGISINVKKYRKSNFGIHANVASVVTTSGSYQLDFNNEYNDIISSKVIALGLSSEDLKIPIFTFFLQEIQKDIDEINRNLDNQQKLINDLRSEYDRLTKLKINYRGLIDSIEDND